MTAMIVIRSYNRFGENEWTEVVEAKTMPAAAKKAYKVLRSAFVKEPKKKFVHRPDLQSWTV